MTAAEIEVGIKLLSALFGLPGMGLVIAVLILPWLVLVYSGFRQERRFEGVLKMYRNNVSLVRDYQQLVEGYRKIVDGQQELVVYVTSTLTNIQTRAESNMFCPITREQIRQRDMK